MKLILSLLLAASSLSATEVTDAFIGRVAYIESRNGKITTDGDAGRAVGVFQFWRIAWDHTSQLRAKAGLPVYPYSSARDAKISQEYAKTYLTYIEFNLQSKLHRAPTKSEIYAGWNIGLNSFRKVSYNINLVPAVTKKAIQSL